MIPIDRPTKAVSDILDILENDNVKPRTLVEIASIRKILTDRERHYISKVLNNTLFEITREQIISPLVDKNKIVSYYDYRILKKPLGREFYDEVILSAPYDTCPYCNVRMVKTIDHFLPKSEYPSYSITPSNLVPCCRDCNTEKKIAYPTSSSDQTFHPYFDKVDTECWIKANLIQTEPLSFYFDVIRPQNWDENQIQRATAHFKSYNLNQLFSNEANRELRSRQKFFKNLFCRDANLLKNHLQENYMSNLEGLGVIDWRTSLYKELSTNQWFLNGCIGTSFFA